MSDPTEGVCLFGAPLDTGNLGVSALGLSTMAALHRRRPDIGMTVFDHGVGERFQSMSVGDLTFDMTLRGGRISWKLHRPESLRAMYATSFISSRLNANVRAIEDSAAVLDISGGDSFTDLYSRKQLDLVTLPKKIALRRGRPLILLPQTYGPFRTVAGRRKARSILERAAQVWARDADSFARLGELLGSGFDPTRHLLGTDVAFNLPQSVPAVPFERLESWIDAGAHVVGINVSGLLYNAPEAAMARFGLAGNYANSTRRLVERFLDRTDAHVLLVAHVPGSGSESDTTAVLDIHEPFSGHERLAVLPTTFRADEVKHVIGRLDWFIGARMHSTIAGLSTRTPTTAVAYSDKFRGIFDACGVGHRVLDARVLNEEELVEASYAAWQEREADGPVLRSRLPEVESIVDRQFDALVDALQVAGGG